MNMAEKIFQSAMDCGYDNCGIISPKSIRGCEKYLKERIEKIPSSFNFYGNMDIFKPVKERFPWAKSIIVCTAEYGKYSYPEFMRGRYAKAYFLSPEEGKNDGFDKLRFEKWLTSNNIRWVNGNGIPLRYAAMEAGLGIIRNNNFFYTDNGSYVNLSAYITDIDCELIQNIELKPCRDSCILCRNACKTNSLCDIKTMDPLKCVSFWTTFGGGNVPEYLTESMFEEWICGCDNCQDVCPYNRKHDWDDGEPFSNLEEISSKLSPKSLLEQSDDFLEKEIIPKTDYHLLSGDSYILRINAKRALLNHEKLEK